MRSTKERFNKVKVTNLESNKSSNLAAPDQERNSEELKQESEPDKSNVTVEDGDMSEMLSSNADVQPNSQIPASSKRNNVNELDMAHRVEVLQLLKDFIDNDGGSHRESSRSSNVLKLFTKDEPGHSHKKGQIEFIGNESLKSMVRFNMDSYLLGLNTFETISMFDHVQQAMTGMKKKLSKVSQHIDNIEKKQNKLDSNTEKMIEKMRAYRELKKEVANLNKAQEQSRPSSKDPRPRKIRKGQKQMQGQQFDKNLSNSNLHSSHDKQQLSLVVTNDIPETSSLPIQNAAESSLALVHEGQTHQTYPNGLTVNRQNQQDVPRIEVHNRNNLIAQVEEMKADQLARFVNRPQNL